MYLAGFSTIEKVLHHYHVQSLGIPSSCVAIAYAVHPENLG